MISRSIRAPPSLILLLALCFFLGYQFSRSPFVPTTALCASPSDSTSIAEPGRANGPRIAIVTFVTSEYSYMYTSLKGKNYARRQGYDLVIDYEEHAKRGTMWWKFEMITRLIKTNKYDWLWWLDFDTLITNTDIKLTDIIQETLANVTNPDEIDYLLTHDCNGLNMGSFVVRAHERSTKVFRDAAAIEGRHREKGEQFSEQDSMVTLLKDDAATSQRTIQVPQWKLNAFPEEISCFDESDRVWEPGMFVLHFAGAWAHVEGPDPTGKLMKKYEGEVIFGDWEDMYELTI
ncbi:unnamed protein product [Periconia digitata]|uniref:Glycosyltransferase family 34 protein n=1 Tax=Periconia digitata TaxID=1303443 RepID=A0A9W4XPE0_9PLEO|nr:unnamed protein product [Periconia digitata]